MQEDLFYGIFAPRLRRLLQKAALDIERLQEVRLRCDRPVLLQYDGKEFSLTPEGVLKEGSALCRRADRERGAMRERTMQACRMPQCSEGETCLTGVEVQNRKQLIGDGNAGEACVNETEVQNRKQLIGDGSAGDACAGAEAQTVCVSREELKETLEYVSGYSLYAFDEELKQGFLTMPGGHRIGVAGRLVIENGKVQCIRHISYINIRLSHQIKGCADAVMRYLVSDGTLCHTLIISPPRCGKTTLLRDLIRQVSNGTRWLAGLTVGVVDERSELAGAYLGIAQNDLGMRTDVLEGGPKAEGMMMLLRSMSPQVIAVDEIGSSEDSCALENVFHCGCRLIATVHGTSMEDIKRRPLLRRMLEEQAFERYIILEGNPAGSVREILDGQGRRLYRR